MAVKDKQSLAASAGWFTRFATWAAGFVGSPGVFVFAVITVIVWLVTGPMFHYSDTWQLWINSWTNVATFIVVFLIQNTQNRDAKAINLKLNELLRAVEPAQEEMIDIERLSDDDLENLADRYQRIRDEWEQRKRGENRSRPTD